MTTKTLTQTELIAIYAEKAGLSKVKAKELLDILSEIVIAEMKSKTTVTIPNLGRFVPKVSKARSCRNPRTGAIMEVPSKAKITFSPSASAKEAVEKS